MGGDPASTGWRSHQDRRTEPITNFWTRVHMCANVVVNPLQPSMCYFHVLVCVCAYTCAYACHLCQCVHVCLSLMFVTLFCWDVSLWIWSLQLCLGLPASRLLGPACLQCSLLGMYVCAHILTFQCILRMWAQNLFLSQRANTLTDWATLLDPLLIVKPRWPCNLGNFHLHPSSWIVMYYLLINAKP